MKNIFDIDYVGDNHSLHKLDVYLPDSENFDIIVYIHGGGLEVGSRKDFNFECFLSENIGIVSVDYRLLPDVKFPQFIEDVACAVSYVKNNLANWGANGRLFVWGSSAGAYITMMLCLDHSYLKNVGLKTDDVTGYISESAQQFAHFNLLKQRGFDSRIEKIDETAPIYYVRDVINIQPLLMMYYSNDMVCRPEENLLMYKSMKRFLPKDTIIDMLQINGDHCEPNRPEERINAISDFIKKCVLGKGK